MKPFWVRKTILNWISMMLVLAVLILIASSATGEISSTIDVINDTKNKHAVVPSIPQGELIAENVKFAKGEKYEVYSGPGKDYLRAADGKAVVLAEEDHRQLPEDRQIDRFIVHAAGGRRLAVIADGDLLRVAELCGKRQAGRDGEAVAEHAVASRNAELRRERVHHAARSAVRPAGLEEKIAHDGVERNTLRQQRPDAAVGIIHKIVFAQADRAADRQRFLPDGRVVMAEIHALVHKFALTELIQNTAGEHRFVRF